ncbi:hypothetical protein [Hymenobacter negativus]|uniref:Uncharacterized protein n=1 Tax=Hymenobacter negativus TaxID=2795026 RepID=A0ABS0QD16_9BACT|nr:MULTISPECIES: hypothetical protein [Bacteria]MBH8560586.1 hypothetical protein [Hymenobacter negativus]MBH8569004.1 hypothetical protein [Hymenobacter negativus]MBR7208739.1 hypothetical protein [Microvirga sp. STS02]
MDFFSFLFRRPVVLEDDFFGRLVLDGIGQAGSSCCFYAAKVMFQPTGTTIECMIDTADATGPSRTQQAFFQQFEQIYASILPEIVRVIENDSRLLAAGSPFVNFTSTHRLAGITIPERASSAVSWEIWFEPIDTSQWGYSVSVDMIGDVPQAGIGISA